VVGKIDELCTIASDFKPDLILLTETWCHEQISDAFLEIPGFELINDLRIDRNNTDKGRGGGLLVYSRKDLPVYVLSIDGDNNHFQYCKFKVMDLTFYLIYRSPNSGADSISGLARLIREAEKNCLFFGDFNLPDIDWEGGVARGRSRELLEAVNDRLMEQLVQFSTHVRGNTLDLLLTDVPERVIDVADEGRLGASDHVLVAARIAVGAGPPPTDRGLPDWGRADWQGMQAELQQLNWDQILHGQSADQAWNTVKVRVEQLVSRHVPSRRRRNHDRPPWLTREILRAIRRKKKLWRRAKQGQNVAEYREAEKAVRNMIRSSKRRFERNIAKGCGSEKASKKRFFAYIRRKTKSRPCVGPLRDSQGRTVHQDSEMAALLNRFFSSVFTREDTTNVPEPEHVAGGHYISDVKITAKAVKEKIKKLRVDSAAGPDGIGPLLLKKLMHELAWPLTKVMRASVREGAVPEDWRTANVTPIYKKGQKSDPGNYRPVSLTSVCSRLLESIIKDQIVEHLDKSGLIRSTQHGFMKGRSCVTNLLVFLEKLTAELDSGAAADVIYLDFAKAFDTVPHERLKKKLRAHGIRGRLLDWISAWLGDRKQRVVLNGNVSAWEAVLSGVPQGSVLGPLLFLIFINDLDAAVSLAELLLKFADDTKVARVISSDADRLALQAALNNLVEWTDKWGMRFNIQKCKVMHVGRNNPQYQYMMAGQQLEATREEKDLGVIVSDNLKPAAQCAKAAKTAQTVLGQITRAFQYRDRTIFPQLYKQYVRPHLEFAVQAWSPWLQADKELLESVQRRAVGMVSGLQSRDYEGRLRELKLTTLEERRHQADMLQMYKLMSGEQAAEAAWFRPAPQAAARTRQNADPLNVRPNHGRLELRRNAFSVRAGEPWNAVPAHIKRSGTAAGFKRAYANHREAMILNIV
jgi:Reverse transcriptase (RNA-dependent DNA polymerase)/Endonuclease-reverse transcriptase